MNAFLARRSLALALLLCLLLLVASTPPLLAQTAPPDAPVLLTPQEGALTTSASHPPLGIPTLVWTPAAGATRYQVQISVSSGFAATVVDAITDNTSYTPLLALGNGIFYWRVRAAAVNTWGPYAEPLSFEVDWDNNETLYPVLLLPEDGATRAAFGPNELSWTALPGAATYRLEIAADPVFANIVYGVETARSQHTPLARLGNNTYYWRVTPIDNKDHAGFASPVWSFAFDWNNAPQPLAPDDGAELPFVPRFSWTAVEAAEEYRLCISTQQDFGDCVPIVTRNTDYTPVTALTNDRDYFWRVQAIDSRGTASPWSAERSFRAQWYFQPQLLSPANNSIRLAYPFFSWAPVPGAERYQIQIASNNVFDNPIVADETIYNVTNYTQPEWREAALDTAYYWRVRAIDAQGNYSPWSATWSFQFSATTTPNLVYPLPYYAPDTVNTPVHGDRSFGAPVFLWDTAHSVTFDPFLPVTPDYYRLEVDDDPAFLSPNFTIDTAGIAAAPTATHPFANLQEQTLYYWRVRAFRNGAQMPQDGVQVTWVSRYSSLQTPLPRTAAIQPIAPADGFEAVQAPPVLSWQPMNGAIHYRVQIARDAAFTTIVDEALATHLHYVPWQERLTPMPYGAYWWRLRGEDSANTPIGDWSAPRHFNLSVDLAIGNFYDFQAPANLAADTSGRALVASSPDADQGSYALRDLYTIVDRRESKNYNQNWVIAFTTGATAADTVRYALYLDTDHVAGSGGAADPLGNTAISPDPYYRPEYVVYVDLTAGVGVSANFYAWNGSTWNPGVDIATIGGVAEFDPSLQSVQLFIPYTALGSADTDWVGSLAMAVYSLEANNVRDSVPVQGATLNNPVFVSNMLLPLYPFDTPMSNPVIQYDMPPLRWRMPAYGTDGYEVQVATDPLFTQIVETWESHETKESPFFTLIPATFQSAEPYANNESYYWRVRTRHEKYRPGNTTYDYGPWSPAMRFKLDSRSVGNPQLSTGVDAFMTPTFTWERVEGASGYTIQIDDDSGFSNPLVNAKTDASSYTPTDVSASLLPGTQYFWRVVMRRSNTIVGHWSPPLSFTKTSVWPQPQAPLNGAILNSQPTLTWGAVLTPSAQPRLAAPVYRVQVANNPAFTSPKINVTTQATSFAPVAGQNLADGVWYWRVAFVDANNKVGPYSPVQSFTKEYPLPQLQWPMQGGVLTGAPTFRWAATEGAAYYWLEYADNSNYNSSTKVTTDLTEHTPVKKLNTTTYYWRVKMYDADRNPGPLIEGRFDLRNLVFLPVVTAQ